MNYSLRRSDAFGRCFLLSQMGKWEPFIFSEEDMGRGKVLERAGAHLIISPTLTNGTGTHLLTPKETLSLPLVVWGFFPLLRGMFSDDFPLNASFPFTLQRALLKNPLSFTQSLSMVAL